VLAGVGIVSLASPATVFDDLLDLFFRPAVLAKFRRLHSLNCRATTLQNQCGLAPKMERDRADRAVVTVTLSGQ